MIYLSLMKNSKHEEIDFNKNQTLNFRYIVIDGYKFNISWQRYFTRYYKENNVKLIRIDDFFKKKFM